MFLVPAVKIQFPVRISKHSLQKTMQKTQPTSRPSRQLGHGRSHLFHATGRVRPTRPRPHARHAPRGEAFVPDGPRCSAECANVLCGKYSSTCRKVQSGTPQKRFPPCAAESPETGTAFHIPQGNRPATGTSTAAFHGLCRRNRATSRAGTGTRARFFAPSPTLNVPRLPFSKKYS